MPLFYLAHLYSFYFLEFLILELFLVPRVVLQTKIE